MDVLKEEKKIAIGSDHRGFKLKNDIINYLKDKGYDVADFGCYSGESADYPDYAKKVSIEISNDKYWRGVLICGSGIGMSIAANRINGVRAALCHTVDDAKMSRNHNNANIIVFAANSAGKESSEKMLDIFLNADFEGGRHQVRVNKIDQKD
ncbi:ribose 5-phosphate isomerase B [candidate division KSB1 bacterium]